MGDFSLYPPRASTLAGQVDLLYTFLLVVGFIMTALIFFFVFFFAIKYRRRPGGPPAQQIHGSLLLEVTWSTVPFLVMLIMFVWGTKLYFDSATPPANTLDLYVTGKQWMWKVQYPGGQREINQIHVPTGVPVKVTLASEDVIHSFFVPAFRVKHDVVPGHYEIVWFQATKPGRYHLFCAEYCGSNHSEMGGWVNVMSPADYEVWLSGGERGGSMVDQGAKLFSQYGCVTCHVLDAKGRCPSLRNVFGHPVQLADGRTVVADEAYVRESILDPNAKIVKGYDRDVMPVFQGQISEEGLLQLIVYVKSLSQPPEQPTPTKALPAAAKGSPK
ncbi:MAG: cytochrome c oxidase subunit II [Bryobacterales bacterium]|nr:cytochrome c oxidase subunit II [Bryobacterales bacterium]